MGKRNLANWAKAADLKAIAVLVAMVLGASARTPAEAADGAGDVPYKKPVAVAPLTDEAPTIDGTIGEDEWPGLHVCRFTGDVDDALEPRMGEFWLLCDGNYLYVAVRSAVNPETGPVAEGKPAGRRDDVERVFIDDAVELWVDNAPSRSAGDHYVIAVNTLGARFDKHYDRRTGGVFKTWWARKFKVAQTVADGVWTYEAALRLKDVRIRDDEPDIGLRVCRNYQNPRRQSRWAPDVTRFDHPDTMPRVRFVKNVPAIQEVRFYDAERNGDLAVRVANVTEDKIEATVSLACGPAGGKRQTKTATLKLAAGESKVVELKVSAGQAETMVGAIHVSGPGSETWYRRDVKWNTRACKLWGDDADDKPKAKARGKRKKK